MCESPVLPVDGKQQGQGSDGLFSTRQIIHGHEAFPRRHAVVVDATEVWLVWILGTQNGLEHIQNTILLYDLDSNTPVELLVATYFDNRLIVSVTFAGYSFLNVICYFSLSLMIVNDY